MQDFVTWDESHTTWCACIDCTRAHLDKIIRLCRKFDRFPYVSISDWLDMGTLTQFRHHMAGRAKVGWTGCSCFNCHRMVGFHYTFALDQRFIEYTLAAQREERENMTQAKAQESTKQAIEIEIEGKKYTVHVAVGAEVQVTVEKEKENIACYLLETYVSDHVHHSTLYMREDTADNAGIEAQEKFGSGYFVTEILIPEEMFNRSDWHAEAARTAFARDLVKAGGGKVVTTGKWKGPQKGQTVEIGGLEAKISQVSKSQPTGMFYDIRLSANEVHVGSVRLNAPTWATLGRR